MRPLNFAVITATLTCLSMGCGETREPEDTVQPEDTILDAVDDIGPDVQPVPEPPHANCGMPSYEFLPAGATGDLVESEMVSMLTLDAATINALLEQFEFSAMSPVPYGVVTHRFRYTTQDRGRPVEATGMLSFPYDSKPFTDPLPVLVYQHGTSGFSDPCAPSNEAFWLQDGALGPAVASLGYIVISPDYIGMNGFGDPSTVRHGYLVGEQTAIGAWDAVRGGLKLLDSLNVHPVASNDVVLWGVSQGAHASLFTELWGPWYAPEFNVRAVVALVPPTDLFALLKKALESINDSTGLLAVSVITMKLWYEPEQGLDLVFTNEEPYFIARDAPSYLFPTEECKISIGQDVDINALTLNQLFTQTAIDAASDDNWQAIAPWDCFYRENALSTTSVQPSRFTPTLMVYGEIDDLVDTASQRPDFETLCGMGYRLDYLECVGAGHSQAALWSLPEQFQWIRDRLAGVPLPESELCQVQLPVQCSATPVE